MSPWEQGIAREGAAKKRKDDYELGLFIAWHVAAFSRSKRMPSWADIQKSLKREPAKQMSAMDIKSFLAGLKDVTPAPLSEKEQRTLAKKQARAKGKR